MVHHYQITGMTCSSCEANVKASLLNVRDVKAVEVSLADKSAIITMDNHIALSVLQKALGEKYQISSADSALVKEPQTSWIETYKPVLLIFLYILVVTAIIEVVADSFDLMRWMRHFMAGFFLVFSFFKMLNLKGFAASYVMYDVIARKIPAWAYVYAFLELLLGIAFLVNFNPFVTNLVTVIVMTISIIGVLQTVLNKKKIQCACLGSVFNLPMSTVTIIEDGLMIAMSAGMLVML